MKRIATLTLPAALLSVSIYAACGTKTANRDVSEFKNDQSSTATLAGKEYCGKAVQLSGATTENCIEFIDSNSGVFRDKTSGIPSDVEFSYSIGQGEVSTVTSIDPLRTFVATYTISGNGSTLTRKDNPNSVFKLKNPTVSLTGKKFCGKAVQLSGATTENCIEFIDSNSGVFRDKTSGIPSDVEFSYSMGQGEVSTVTSIDPLRTFVATYTISGNGSTLTRKDNPNSVFKLKK